MTRLAVPVAAAASVLFLAAPSLGADYFGSQPLRTGFGNLDDGSGLDNPLTFELGLRYWYSWGAQSFNAGGAKLTDNDNSQMVEGQFRIDDASTNYYAKGVAGMSFDINGTSTGGPPGQPSTVTDGRIAYAGADVGYSWLGNNPHAKFGPFAGYMYWNDSPNLGRANYSTDGVSGNSQENNVEVNALRLGVSGKVDLGDYFDISGEFAAVPYAKISGDLGALGFAPYGPANAQVEQASAMSIDGWGYGAMAEAMLGFHPTQNMVLRVGGRAWYLQGKADETYNQNVVDTTTSPATVTSSQSYISTANPWSLFRYGLLAEMSYTF
jgi:hypothetical protein